MDRSPNNFRKQKLIDCEFLQKIEYLKVSDRNIQITKEYANGSFFKELAEKYYRPKNLRNSGHVH